MYRNHNAEIVEHMTKHVLGWKEGAHLEVRAKGGQNDAMAGELLATAAQRYVAEGVVESEAVEALQDRVGVFSLHEQVVLAARRGSRC